MQAETPNDTPGEFEQIKEQEIKRPMSLSKYTE